MRRFLLTHVWCIGALALVITAALPVLTYPMWRDHGMYANIARAILNGGTPYIDMWDIKPPPIYYIYAAGIALFGGSTIAIRAIDFVFVPLAMMGMYWLGTRIVNRRMGALAALLYGVFYFTETYASLTQSDSLVTLPMILAAVSAVKAADSQGRRALLWSFVTGLLCGLILWFKHYNAFFVAALAIHYLWIRRQMYLTPRPPLQMERGRQTPLPAKGGRDGGGMILPAVGWYQVILYEAAAFTLGGLLTAGGLLVYFWSKGMIQEMLFVAQGTAAYNAQGYDLNEFLFSMRNYLYYRWRHWGVLIGLVAVWLPLKYITQKRYRDTIYRVREAVETQRKIQHFSISALQPADPGTQNPEVRTQQAASRQTASQPTALSTQHSLVFLWLIAGLAFVLIQAKGFDTHWIPMMPALALLAAESLDWLVDLIGAWSPARIQTGVRRGAYALATAGLLVIVLHSTWFRAFDYLTGRENRVQYFSRFNEGGDLQPAQSLQMVEWLQPRLVPGDTIYIWGFRPEVAYMGGWRPATRFQAQFPVVAPWYPAAWKQENVDILWAAMPPYVLVLEADYMPWVNGSGDDSHQLLVKYTELNNWLIANYERLDTKIGHFLIWERRP